MKYFDPTHPIFPEMNPAKGFFAFLLVFIGAYLFAQGIAIGIVALAFDFGDKEMLQMIAKPETLTAKTALLIIQSVGQLLGFVGAAVLFIRFVEKSKLKAYIPTEISFAPVGLTILLTLLFMVINSVVIEWNMGLEFDSSFWRWAKEREDELAMMTKDISKIYNIPDFIFTFFVISIVAGLSEEIVFRGILQTKLWQWFGNVHVAIWVSAFLFSAIHMQFFGFVPRMLLGALFGYLFYFSGNIWYAIIAHMANNGITIIMMYVLQLSETKVELEEMDAAPWWMVGLVSVISIFIFKAFIDFFKNKSNGEMAKGI